MRRYSSQLVPQMLELAKVWQGQSALDVDCGPGALTSGRVARLGAQAVCAVDPSGPFVAASRQRHPGVDVRQAGAEQLPFDDRRFDVALAQLVVHFMADPVALSEMRRVVRVNGVVAACVWDHAAGRSPVADFWRVAVSVDPTVQRRHGARARVGIHAGFGAAGRPAADRRAGSVGSRRQVVQRDVQIDESVRDTVRLRHTKTLVELNILVSDFSETTTEPFDWTPTSQRWTTGWTTPATISAAWHLTRSFRALGRIRTCDARFRKPTLYPLSYEGGDNAG